MPAAATDDAAARPCPRRPRAPRPSGHARGEGPGAPPVPTRRGPEDRAARRPCPGLSRTPPPASARAGPAATAGTAGSGGTADPPGDAPRDPRPSGGRRGPPEPGPHQGCLRPSLGPRPPCTSPVCPPQGMWAGPVRRRVQAISPAGCAPPRPRPPQRVTRPQRRFAGRGAGGPGRRAAAAAPDGGRGASTSPAVWPGRTRPTMPSTRAGKATAPPSEARARRRGQVRGWGES